jgi:GH3 auxin-responsive promoter
MAHVGTLALRVIGPYQRKRFYAMCRDPAAAQQRLLRAIIQRNADSVFGRRHGFRDIKTFEDYRRRVPISSYEDLRPYIVAATQGEPNQLTTRAPLLFTTTSGTTGASKYIPMTREGRRDKSRLMRLWLYGLFRDHPGITAGRIMSVVSPEVESYTPNRVPCGAESGHTYRNLPRVVRWMYSAPYEVFTVRDYEAKYYALLRIAAGQDITCIVTPNPSTIVLLADRLAQHTEPIIRDVRDGSLSPDFAVPPEVRASLRLRPDPRRASELERAAAMADGSLVPALAWPNIAAIGCWKGGTVGSYLTKFHRYFPHRPPIRDLGYLATEVSGSVPLTDEGDGGVLAVATSVFEFLPEEHEHEPQGHDLLAAEQLEEGRRYYIYVTTASGLYRYDMNDIVEVAGFFEHTPMIRFVQKGKGVVSFTGEKLYEVQVIAAVEEALAARRGGYHFIAAVAELVEETGRPRLVFLTEFDDPIGDDDGPALVDRLDRAVGGQNSEYQAKRKSGRYDPPIIRVVRSGEFDGYRRRMVEGGRADGQFKVLRLTSDTSFASEFKAERDIVGRDGQRVVRAVSGTDGERRGS